MLPLLLLVPLALAGRVERLTELQAAGSHAEVVETVAKWEASGELGDEAAVLRALRDRSAYTLAEQAGTVEAFQQFRATYPGSRLVKEALAKEATVAFSAAQSEGTSAAMRAFLAAYPDAPTAAQARSLATGWAFEEAVEAGTPDAIAAFVSAHPDSPLVGTAWESLAARTPGIHVRLADGLPRLLDPVPVVDGKVAFPKMTVMAPARPTVAVNLPGTGRGETSEWWGLYAVDADGKLGAVPPVGRLWADAVGAAPPFLLDLVALPGVHAARVAAPPEPLVVPGACTGKARFAFVLTADGKQTAFPFAVDCKATVPEDAASPVFFSAFASAEDGHVDVAEAAWARAVALPAGRRFVSWLETYADDPAEAFVRNRPARGDVLLWDGATTTWWHAGPDGAAPLAHRDGLWIADGPRLWRWDPRVEPFAAPAEKGCKAASGERTGGGLVNVRGEERVDVPFATARGGRVTPAGWASGTLTVTEAGTGDGCAKPPAPATRTVPVPGARVVPAPGWAAEKLASAPGHSVVTDAPWGLFAAFRGGAATEAAGTEAPGTGAGAETAGAGAAGAVPAGEAPAAPASEAPPAPASEAPAAPAEPAPQ